MPNKPRKCIKTLDKIIDICTSWKEHIVNKTEKGKDLLIEFEEEGVLEVLSDYLN